MKRQFKNSIVRDIKGDGIPSLGVGGNPNVPSEPLSSTLEKANQTEGCLHDAVPNNQTISTQSLQSQAHWYTLRCTYGRERKAYDFFIREGFKAFFPVITTPFAVNGNAKERSLPNILFVYGTFEQLIVYVYDNIHFGTKNLRFYYNQKLDRGKEPLIIPNEQMDSLIKICAITAEDKRLDPYVVEKFKSGKNVRVIDGPYKDLIGVVGRYKGQQRIGIVIGGLFTITTSYVPKDFIDYNTT